jgi:hypothetical protein
MSVRVHIHALSDGAAHVGLILSVATRPTISDEFVLHLPATGRAALAELAARLLSREAYRQAPSRVIAVLCIVCDALRQPVGAAESLARTCAAPDACALEAARGAVCACAPTARARWAVVWALLGALATNGVHDTTAWLFVHALADALAVPSSRVHAAEDGIACELSLVAADRQPSAAGRADAAQPALAGSATDAYTEEERAATELDALVLTDVPVLGGSINRRWALTLSALGGGTAFVVGGPMAGVALAGAFGTAATFIVGAAATTLTAHYSLETDAQLLAAERRGGCAPAAAAADGADWYSRRGLALTIYAATSWAPSEVVGARRDPQPARPSAWPPPRSGRELLRASSSAAAAAAASASAAAAQLKSSASADGDADQRALEAAARAVWSVTIGQARWGEHRVLLWQPRPLIASYASALDAAAGARAQRQQVPAQREWPTSAGAAGASQSLTVAAWEAYGVAARAAGALAAAQTAESVGASLWLRACARAEWSGATLARQVLRTSALGSRPIALVGASHGALAVLACLAELASSGAYGLVHSVCLLGAPISLADPRWDGARALVLGRFVNVHCADDALLLALGAGDELGASTWRRRAQRARGAPTSAVAAAAATAATHRHLLAGVHGAARAQPPGHSLGGVHEPRRPIEDVEIELGPLGHRAYSDAEELGRILRHVGFHDDDGGGGGLVARACDGVGSDAGVLHDITVGVTS